MKNTFILLLCFFSANTFAQKPFTPTLKVVYQYYEMKDSAHPNYVRQEKMALLAGQTGSNYFSETAREQKERNDKLMEEAMKKDPDNININMGRVRKVNSDKYYFFPLQHKKYFYVTKKYHRNKYLITEPKTTINWKIQKEVKKIGGYNCQLATGMLDGEEYEAWFTSDLPYSYGPWKLQGLPGLILQARNSDNTRRFEFDTITNPYTGKEIALPKEVIKTSMKNYNRMVKAGRNSSQPLPPGFKVDKSTLIKH